MARNVDHSVVVNSGGGYLCEGDFVSCVLTRGVAVRRSKAYVIQIEDRIVRQLIYYESHAR